MKTRVRLVIVLGLSVALVLQTISPATAFASTDGVLITSVQQCLTDDVDVIVPADSPQILKTPRVTTKVYKYSWHDIKKAVGTGASLITVLGFISKKVGIGTGELLAGIGGIANLASNLMSDSTEHGIAVRVRISRYYRRGSNIPWRTSRSLAGIWTY